MDSNSEVVYLDLDDIIPNRFQPREVFDEQALKELAVSIKEHGVIQPIIVRKVDNKYEIIAGERRYKASTMAGLTKIPALVKNLDDKESSKVALIENLQRRDLTPIEEARTYQKILELEDGMTQEELAATMGKTQSSVSNKLRLLALPDEVQDALLNEKISERHARSLLNIDNVNDQVKMLSRIVEEKLTVRELDKIIKEAKEGPEISEGSEESPSLDNEAAPVAEETTDNASMGIGIGLTSDGSFSVETPQEENFEEIVETDGQEEATEENNETQEILENADSDTVEEENAEAEAEPEIRDMTGEEQQTSNQTFTLDNLDISKMANPFAKPEDSNVEAQEEVVEDTTESSNVSSSIEEPKLNIPSFNIGSMLNSTPTETKEEEKPVEEAPNPLPPPLPPMPQEEKPAAPEPVPAKVETTLPPATLPIGNATSSDGDKEKFYEELEKLVESYKGKGFIGDYKKFDFGNFSTITITLNNLK